MITDKLGEIVKSYEAVEAMRRLDPGLPIIVRLDGRHFSSFTRGLARPYDVRLQSLMELTTMRLVEESNACIGYTQSDEISLILYKTDIKTEPYFGGRTQKIVSSLASYASVIFNKNLPLYIPEKALNNNPTFDCRAWNVPTKQLGIDTLIWREQDAIRNAIQSTGHTYFSHNSLLNVSNRDIKERLLKEKNINFDQDYPHSFRYGIYVKRQKTLRAFTPEEINNLPLKHQARLDPGLMVERTEIVVIPGLCLTSHQSPEAVVYGQQASTLIT